MGECFAINPAHIEKQIGYLGVLPGKTSTPGLKSLLGSPKVIASESGRPRWDYDNASFYIDNDIVSLILVMNTADIAKDLRSFIMIYGCPNVIYLSKGELPKGTNFIFLNLGIEFGFSGYPIKLDSPLQFGAMYFIPTTLSGYIEKYEYNWLVTPSNVEFISWDQAINK